MQMLLLVLAVILSLGTALCTAAGILTLLFRLLAKIR
jgi:hypothetical protein